MRRGVFKNWIDAESHLRPLIFRLGLISALAVIVFVLLSGSGTVFAGQQAEDGGYPGENNFISADRGNEGVGRLAGVDRPEVQRLIEAINFTGSSAPIFLQGWIVPQSELEPTTNLSGPLVNANSFRADPRFTGIEGNGYAVAVIDTGINLSHPFFSGRIVYHYDFADGDDNASDANGHGSNVASIVGSSDSTYTGMAPGCDLIALKVFKNSGSGSFAYVESALQWVVANAETYNIVAINMSIGDGGNYNTTRQLYGIDDELAALKAMGVIVASAAGNSFYSFGSAQGVSYPAADPSSYRIGAVYDSNAGSFNYGSGAVAYSSGEDRVTPFSQRSEAMQTTMAPGAPITGAAASGSGTVTMHGTSQASPHIAGIAALMQQLAYRELGRLLTPDEFNSLMRDSAVIVNDGDDEDDNVTNTGLDFPRVDILAFGEAILDLAGISLPMAIDQPTWTVSTGGNADWFGQTDVTHDGIDAAQSGDISDSQNSWMEATVDGAGELSFWWKVDSELNFDFLKFSINGVQQAQISGNVDWSQQNYTLGEGEHTLRWEYYKDGSVSTGEDCGWVDQVVWTPDIPLPDFIVQSITLDPVSAELGSNIKATVVVKNQGDESGDGGRLDFYYNKPSEAAVGEAGNAFVSVGSLSPGQTKSFEHNFSAPGPVGSKLFRAFVDSHNATTESNEANNQLTENYTVTSQPDFIIESITLAPTTIEQGRDIKATVVVKNQGTAAADAGFLDLYYHKADPASVGEMGNWFTSVGILNPGQTQSYEHTFAAPGPPGAKVFRAFIDTDNDTAESDETNNQLTEDYQVEPPLTAGYIWSVNGAGYIYTRTGVSNDLPQGTGWQRIPGVLTRVSVAPGGVWGVNRSGSIYYRDSLEADDTPWTQVAGFLNLVSAGPTGAVWGVQTWNGNIYLRDGITEGNPTGTGWVRIPGALVFVEVGSRGVWGINGSGRIYYRDSLVNDGEPWVNVPGILRRISVGPNGEVWGVNSSGFIYVRKGITEGNPAGTHWEQYPGRLTEFAVGDNLMWGINASDHIYFRPSAADDGVPWERIPGLLRQISIGGFATATSSATAAPSFIERPVESTEDDSQSDGVSAPIYTEPAIPNQPPVADAGGDRTVSAGMLVRLSGEGSFDPDGEIILYEWDLTGDGKYESLGMKPTTIFYSPGNFTVRLRVTDNDGQ